MATTAHVPLSQLAIDPANIRHAGAGAEPVYIATIEQHGVIEPLIVRPETTGVHYLVMQGGKRLASLQKMARDGLSARGTLVTNDYPVPVVVRTDIKTAAAALETSLVTAICHMPIHPVDQYEAFAALADPKGGALEPDEIARRFGCTRRIVDQRLALGRLSPKIREEFRAGNISAEIAAAFTLTSDHAHQNHVLETLTKSGAIRWGGASHQVKHAIAGKDGESGGAALLLIGIEAYEAAGGKVMRDLFNEGDSIVNDPPLLKRLANETVIAACKTLTEQGWAWAHPDDAMPFQRWQYKAINKKKTQPTPEEAAEIKRLEAIVKALDEWDGEGLNEAATAAGVTLEQLDDDDFGDGIREQLEGVLNAVEGRAFTAKDKTKSGCAVAIGRDGKLLVTYGLIEPERSRASSSSSSSAASTSRAAAAPEKKKGPPTISNTLKREMRHWLAVGTQQAIVADTYKDPRAMLLARLVADQIGADGGNAWAHMNAYSDKEMAALRDQATPAVMKAAMLKAFDAERYFSGVPQSFRIKHLAEMGHDGAAPAKAKETVGLCKKLAASTSWLPPELRWAHYAGPVGGKAKAKRKARR
jgi:ParB family chromosome partitioning protein